MGGGGGSGTVGPTNAVAGAIGARVGAAHAARAESIKPARNFFIACSGFVKAPGGTDAP